MPRCEEEVVAEVMKRHQVLAASSLVIFLAGFVIAENLPGFLRTDAPGDAMLGGCIGLLLWAVALMVAAVAAYYWYRSKTARVSDRKPLGESKQGPR